MSEEITNDGLTPPSPSCTSSPLIQSEPMRSLTRRQRRLSGLQQNVDQQERTDNQCTKRGKLDEEVEEGESLLPEQEWIIV